MKQRKYILIATLTAVTLLGSCKKEFLERPPQDQLSESTFWTSEKDAYASLNAIYSGIDGSVESAIYGDGATDNAHAQYPWESNATVISLGDVTTGLNEGFDYTIIRRANYFLENVDKTPMDETLKNRFKAEGRFLRAFKYANMVNKFGDLPLIKTTVTPEEAAVARSPKAEVVKFITDELGEIAAILPASYAGGKSNEIGRITKGAALALKARVHLYNEQWQDAVAAAEQVMALNYNLFTVSSEAAEDIADDYASWVTFANASEQTKFRLGVRSYEQLFWEENEGNIEVILDRQHIQEKDTKYSNTYLLSDDLGGWSSVAPTQNLVDEYGDYKDGKPVATISPAARAQRYASRASDPAFYQEYKNRDPRFYATILFDKSPWNRISDAGDYEFIWRKGGNNCSKTGYNFRKYVDPSSTKQQLDSYANHILIRFAEVLLTYAEAKNELSGPDASVYAALNRIRTRAGLNDIDQTTYGGKETLRTAIRHERRVELALEGHRYMDIRRWKIAPAAMTNIFDITNGLVQTRLWNDKLYLMPIPQAEIDRNPKLAPNNNGY